MKHCPKCATDKPLSDFYKNKSRKDGHMGYCKECHKLADKSWKLSDRNNYLQVKKSQYENNKEKHTEGVYRWRKNNPDKMAAIYTRYSQNNKEKVYLKNNKRRVRVKDATFVILDKEIKRLYSGNCIHCGATENTTMDHLIPVSRGGRHSIGNLVPMCKSCNSSKGKRLYAEWRYKNGRHN